MQDELVMKQVVSRWYNSKEEAVAEAGQGQEEDAGHGQGERPPGSSFILMTIVVAEISSYYLLIIHIMYHTHAFIINMIWYLSFL